MLTKKDLQKYRQAIEEAVVGLGRDDIGVGDLIEARDGVLSVTFSRGTHTSVEDIPVDQLQSKADAERVVRSVILTLSKRVAQESLHKA
jgi:hypothetical protein